eukprot:905935-Alexandrium_andersonii.AAC.1
MWGDIRLTEAAVDTFALHGDVGSLALVKKPRQLSPVGSVAALALEDTHSRSWRVVASAEERRADWAVA